MSKYEKTFSDEVDWKIIDQLHSATAKFSSASIELKKMFIILIGISIPAIIKLSNSELDLSLFISTYILSFTFWYLDSFTFYHQENLRSKMDERFSKLRNKNTQAVNETDEYTLEDNRTESDRWYRAFTNSSVRLYHIFIGINTLALILYLTNIIK